jgi:hypothetical protein
MSDAHVSHVLTEFNIVHCLLVCYAVRHAA